MEILNDNSTNDNRDDNSSAESSCTSSFSSDVSEETEIPEDFNDEARLSKRKIDWEERFKRVSEKIILSTYRL